MHQYPVVDGDIKVTDLLCALAWRTRDLLFHRMKYLCQDDELLSSKYDAEGDAPTLVGADPLNEKTIEERLSDVAQEIAQDAALALWTFGYVRAVSGIPSEALLQVCCTILCQNPMDLRQRAQNDYPLYLWDQRSSSASYVEASFVIGSNDAVEKLARSEDFPHSNDDLDQVAGSDSEEELAFDSSQGYSQGEHEQSENSKDSLSPSSTSPNGEDVKIYDMDDGNEEELDDGAVLLDWLSPKEVNDVMWALAAHGERREGVSSKHPKRRHHLHVDDRLSETAAALCDISFDRILAWLRQDRQTLKLRLEREPFEAPDSDEGELSEYTESLEPEQIEPQEVGSEDVGEKIESSDDLLESRDEPSQVDRERPVDDIIDEGLTFPVTLLRPGIEESDEENRDDINDVINRPREAVPQGTGNEAADLGVLQTGVAVDAATLLAAEESEQFMTENPDFSRGMLEISGDESGIAVDAATLLAAEEAGEFPVSRSESPDEVIVNDTLDGLEAGVLNNEESILLNNPPIPDAGSSVPYEYPEDESAAPFHDQSPKPQDEDEYVHRELIFGPSELCTIAWAVTELKDSLRVSVIMEVAKNIALRGSECLVGQSGSTLSNIAQAISKVVVEVGNDENSDNLQVVLDWVAQEAYRSTEGELFDQNDEANMNILSRRLLEHFEPPELSRLVFSLAAARCSTCGDDVRATKSTVGLVTMALAIAGEKGDLCDPEEVACIVFAYLELVYPLLSDRKLAEADIELGKLLVKVEFSLSEWESGALAASKARDRDDRRRRSRLVSFFGRRWSKRDHEYEESSEDYDDYTVPSLLSEKARLPLLKDFPVDPSTLSKLTWSSSCLARSVFPSTSDTLARVALRLFTSRNGRLLREECQIYDLASIGTLFYIFTNKTYPSTFHRFSLYEFAGLARAAVTVGSSLRELVSLFARRLVKVLNECPGLWETSPPIHSAALLFSLGRLGVKYNPSHGQDASTIYRRLQLVSPLPRFNSRDLDLLPPSVLVQMVRSFVPCQECSEGRGSHYPLFVSCRFGV